MPPLRNSPVLYLILWSRCGSIMANGVSYRRQNLAIFEVSVKRAKQL